MDLLAVLYAGRYQRGEGEKHASTRRKEGRGGERREGRGRESNGDVYRTGVFSSAASYFPPSLPSFPLAAFPPLDLVGSAADPIHQITM